MNRRVVFLSAFAAVLLMSLAAYAQDRPRQGGPGQRMGMGMGGSSAMLLRSEAVQKELGVTEEQVKKIQELAAAGRPQRGERPDFQNMTNEERQKARQEAQERAAEQEKKINEILNEKQQARLKQIRLQVAGPMAIASEELAKELGITEEQQGKFRALREELRPAPGQGAARGAGGREQMTAKVMEILTEDQKAKYKELLGEPFDTAGLFPRGGRAGRNVGN